MEKSKFFNMKSKKKEKEEVKPVEQASFSKEELDALLETVEESMKAIAEVEDMELAPPPTTTIENKPEVVVPSTKKAYNIWLNPDTKMYVLDTIEYDGNQIVNITTKNLTMSQPMAMYEIKKIFTDKLILKRGGM